MTNIDSLCGIILAAGGACVFLVVGWSEGEIAGIVAAAIYAWALLWLVKRFQEKNTEIETLKDQHAVEITKILNASRDKANSQT
jgi:uncharacterized protein (DUF697 family)